MTSKTKVYSKGFCVYLEPQLHFQLKEFSGSSGIPMSKLIRESLVMRMSPNDKYMSGFNNGLKTAMFVIAEHKASQMRFPSGKSFAELLNTEVEKHLMESSDERKNFAKSNAAGSNEGSTSGERQADADLGV